MRTLTPDPDWSSWAGAGRSVVSALVVVTAICVVFGLVAAVFRSPATTVVVLGGFVVALFATTEWGHRSTWVPFRAIAGLLGADQPPFGLTDARFWDRSLRPLDIYHAAPRLPIPVASSVIWALVWVAASVLAARAFLRRPIV